MSEQKLRDYILAIRDREVAPRITKNDDIVRAEPYVYFSSVSHGHVDNTPSIVFFDPGHGVYERWAIFINADLASDTSLFVDQSIDWTCRSRWGGKLQQKLRSGFIITDHPSGPFLYKLVNLDESQLGAILLQLENKYVHRVGNLRASQNGPCLEFVHEVLSNLRYGAKDWMTETPRAFK